MAAREYDDFEPTMNWTKEDKFDMLVVDLPGFRKDQLKVQITSAGKLRVLGERQVSGNKWKRFHKETPISSNYDVNKISAKFDSGRLHVKFPKIIIPAEPRGEAKPAVQQPTPPPVPTTPKPAVQPTPPPVPTTPKPAVQPTPPPVPTTPKAEPRKIDQKQDTKEPPKAEKAPAKPADEEKKQKKSTEDEGKPKEIKEESKKAEAAKDGPETAFRQKKREDLVEKKATEKVQEHADTADTGKKASDIGKPRAENYNEDVGSFITKLKTLRHVMNTMVAALLILAIGLYVRHAFRSLGTPKSDPEL